MLSPVVQENDAQTPKGVLARMLDRLLAALVTGANMNCRPHNSRQRIDLSVLSRFADTMPIEILKRLLGDERQAKCVAAVKEPREGEDPQTWRSQESLLAKLRGIAEDARTYEQDTGARSLFVGFPLLHLPETASSRRILAPVALIPVTLKMTRGVKRAIELRCAGEGVDRVIPNAALFAWIERQTGKDTANLFNDPTGDEPMREIAELVKFVAGAMGVQSVASLEGDWSLAPAPTADTTEDQPAILPSAIFGLFPQFNEALLRDTQALVAGEPLNGPIAQFVELRREAASVKTHAAVDRLITEADPFQANAVRLARQSAALVVHGPPGTGKSQTITNIIGDHLARGQRVLLVSDKRTALDVVANRLRHLGLGHLFGVVHDPQRDRRPLYQALRDQLEQLPAATSDARAETELERLDEELAGIRAQIANHFEALGARDERGRSFQDLVAEWFSIDETVNNPDVRITLSEWEKHEPVVESLLRRSEAVNYASNPWRPAAGIELSTFMDRVMGEIRGAMTRCVAAAREVDEAGDALPLDAEIPLEVQAAARANWAQKLADLTMSTDPTVLQEWSSRSLEEARAVKPKLDDAATLIPLLTAGPLDAELLAQCERRSAADGAEATAHFPSVEESTEQWRTLRDYAEAYRDAAARLATTSSAARGVSQETVSYWLTQGPAICERAKKRLIAMGTLVRAIGETEVDRELSVQIERQPITVQQVIAWIPSLHDYVHAASRWYRFLLFGHRKPAKPIARYFGLPLNLQSGKRMLDFLTGLRHRLDLKADLEHGIVRAPLSDLPGDEELLDAYEQHLSAVKAACDPSTPGLSGMDLNSAAVHPLIPEQADAATLVLKAWDLDLSPATADRLATFLSRLGARLRLSALYNRDLDVSGEATQLAEDMRLKHAITHHGDAVNFVVGSTGDNAIASAREAMVAAMANPVRAAAMVEDLRRSAARAKAIVSLIESLKDSSLFAPQWIAAIEAKLRLGREATAEMTPLVERLPQLEGVLRTREAIGHLPADVRSLVESAPDATLAMLRKAVLQAEIKRRLETDAALRAIDGHTMSESLRRYRDVDARRQDLAREVIKHRWLTTQKGKLLAEGASRLGHAGAELRRRLTLRGEKATRLRQVVQLGRQIDGGDPLFDLCPVWMASPETVAQIFPREAIFDVVIFDEASQCRLEEALPVLLRAKRVVVAGDPQQLPPTRFFEAGVEESEEDEIESEQALFESQQGQTEDLLAGALGLAIDECSLDVHYRSRRAGLIEFSNEHFYRSRLQPIPGHPTQSENEPAVKLYRVEGTYEKRRNEREADEVCRIVAELLKHEKPPSIGIACFNLPQRDLIVEKLDAMAEEDADFGKKLNEARKRQGDGSFEGLFVKNLENVQGDERDHMIISTTYGPDKSGRFRRQFGPLGLSGGGRRLNVLVTRAREMVHVITSVPRAAYASLPPTPEGMIPSGGYLLLQYLKDAEREHATPPLASGRVRSWPTRSPSRLVEALAARMTKEGIGCDVYWGNEGFCIDLVRHGEPSAGLLCDAPRFAAVDAVEWDVFRTGILEANGWNLHRVWSPHFFRDPDIH